MALALSCAGPFAQGGGIQLQYQSQRAAGMAHTGTGIARDASAIYFNPGALLFCPRGDVQIGASLSYGRTRFLAQTPSVYRADMNPQVLSPLSVFAHWRGQAAHARWSGGIGLYQPFGYVSAWPEDWKGKFITQEYEVGTLVLQPTVCRRISPRWSAGLGLSLALGSYLSRRAMQVDGPNDTEGSALLNAAGTGLGLNLGVYFQPNDRFSAGLSWRSPLRIELAEGSARYVVPESLGSQYPDQFFSALLLLPGSLSLGIAFEPEARLRVAADLEIAFWARIDSFRLRGLEPVEGFLDFPARHYVNTMALRVGGEYNLGTRWALRGGLFYDGSPVPQRKVSPELPDSDRIGLTLGAGMQLHPRWALDFSYQYAFSGERFGLLEEALFGGTYQSEGHTGGVGIKYYFR
jgi:long-chain fatty acid transport protein